MDVEATRVGIGLAAGEPAAEEPVRAPNCLDMPIDGVAWYGDRQKIDVEGSVGEEEQVSLR